MEWEVSISYEPGNLCEPTGWKFHAIHTKYGKVMHHLYDDGFADAGTAERAARIAIATWQCQQHEPYSFKVETHGH